jgi:hypothetical protein
MLLGMSFLVLSGWLGLGLGWACGWCWANWEMGAVMGWVMGLVRKMRYWKGMAGALLLMGEMMGLCFVMRHLDWMIITPEGRWTGGCLLGLVIGLGAGVFAAWRMGREGGMEKVRWWRAVLAVGMPAALLVWHLSFILYGARVMADGLERQVKLLRRESAPAALAAEEDARLAYLKPDWSSGMRLEEWGKWEEKEQEREAKRVKQVLEATMLPGYSRGREKVDVEAVEILLGEAKRMLNGGNAEEAVKWVEGAQRALEHQMSQDDGFDLVVSTTGRKQAALNRVYERLLPRVKETETLERLKGRGCAFAVIQMHRALDWDLEQGLVWQKKRIEEKPFEVLADPMSMTGVKRSGWSEDAHMAVTGLWRDWRLDGYWKPPSGGEWVGQGAARKLAEIRCREVMVEVVRYRLRTGKLPVGMEDLAPVVGFENLGRGKSLVTREYTEGVVTLENKLGVVMVKVEPPENLEKDEWWVWDVKMECDFSGMKRIFNWDGQDLEVLTGRL